MAFHPYEILALPWDDFPDDFRDAIAAKQMPSRRSKRDLNAFLAEYILKTLHKTDIHTVRSVVNAVLEKYPEAYEETIGGKKMGTGFLSFVSNSNNAVQYRRQISSNPNLRPKKRRSAVNSDDESEGSNCDDPQPEKPKLDDYGCRRWLPRELPPNETDDTIKIKKEWLLEQYHSDLCPDPLTVQQILRFMDITYIAQRSAIVNRPKKGTVDSVLIEWPYLREEEHFLNHATKLIKENPGLEHMTDTWNERLNEKIHILWRLLNISCSTKHIKRSTKNQREKLEKMSAAAKEARESCKSQNSDMPKTLATFLLVSTHFKENFSVLMQLAETVPTSALMDESGTNEPYLIVVGESLYASSVEKVLLVVEKKIIMTCKTPLKGLVLLILSFFVFGLEYPAAVSKTLEFFQRVFLDINPPEGAKRGSSKRTADSLPPAVRKLIQELNEEVA